MQKESLLISPSSRERLISLLRSADVRHHGAFGRLFGMVPPNKLLCLWSEAVGVNPHYSAAFFAYGCQQEFVHDFERISSWFGIRRVAGSKKVVRKPEEEQAEEPNLPKKQRTVPASEPLLNEDWKRQVADTALGPLGDSVWRWSHVHKRWTELGLSIPTATTTVEGGFRSLRVGIFMQMTHTLSEANFNRYCRLVILALN